MKTGDTVNQFRILCKMEFILPLILIFLVGKISAGTGSGTMSELHTGNYRLFAKCS